MTHASVFSGIGGPEVAAVMLGWENLFHCEINPFGRTVLDYWFPNSKSYEDITTTDFSEWRGRVNVLTGGFPCQPFSYAGQRRGAQDDRYLWPYMFRCIDQVQPDWVVAENVAGILTMVEQGEVSEVASSADLFDSLNDIRGYRLRETFTLQRICDDLEGHGYSVQPVLIPACAVGAPHRRDRVFIIGHRRDAVTANTNLSANGRNAGEDASESQPQGLQERDKVRQSDEPSQVRPTGANLSQDPVCGGQLVGRDGEQGSERNERDAGARGGQRLRGETSWPAPADTVGSGAGAPGASGSTQSYGSDTNQQQSQRRATPQWSDRFYAILRHATDTDGALLQRGNGKGAPDSQSRHGVESLDSETERKLRREFSSDTESQQGERMRPQQSEDSGAQSRQFGGGGSEDGNIAGCGRWQGFPTVSPVHRGNDGLPFDVDDLTLPFGKWRTESLKAYGNAIVPQVMYEIFRAIDQIERN